MKRFNKAVREAKVEILGVEKARDGKTVQKIVGRTKILGEDYIFRIDASGKVSAKGAVTGGRGVLIKTAEGKIKEITGFETISTSRLTGEARAVKPGDVVSLKKVIGKGFLSKENARITYRAEIFSEPRVTPTGKIIVGKGYFYPKAKFQPAGTVAGRIKTIGKITRVDIGEKRVKMAYKKTDYGWVYGKEAYIFEPRVSGYIVRYADKAEQAVKNIVGGKGAAKTVAKTEVTTVPASQITGVISKAQQVKPPVGLAAFPSGTVASITEQAAKQKLSFGTGLISRAVTLEKEKIVSMPRLITKERQKSKQLTKPLSLLPIKQLPKEEPELIPTVSTAQFQRQTQKQGQKTKTALKVSQVGRGIDILQMPPPFTPPPTKSITPLFPEEITYEEAERTGYNTYVKVKGKWKKISDKPLTKEAAKDLGARVVDNSVARSFKIEPIKEKKTVRGKVVEILKRFQKSELARGDNYFEIVKRDLRKPIKKGMPKKVPVWVEKSRAAINTLGEKKQLSAARYLAAKRKESQFSISPIKLRKGRFFGI